MKKWLAFALCALLLLTSAMTVCAVPENETTTTTAVEGDIFISMELKTLDDGRLNVLLLDDRGGVVSMWPVSLSADGQVLEELITDMSGAATFSATIPAEASDVVVKAVDGEYAGTVFVGCSMTVTPSGEMRPATTAPETTDTTAVETEPTASADSESTVTEPTEATEVVASANKLFISTKTLQEQDTRVAVGVDVDEALVNVSKTAGADWNEVSLLWMDKAHYASLVSDPQATIHLQLNNNAAAASRDRLVAAKNADETLKEYADEEVIGFAMDLKMIYADGADRVELEPTDSMYTIEMPVPALLADCQKIAVGVCTEKGVDSFLQIKPTNGVLKFSVKRFQTLALVGFGSGGAVKSVMETPSLLVVFGIVGLLLIATGVFFIVFFVLRRRKAAVLDDLDNDAKDDTRQIMLAPTADVVVGKGDGSDKEEVETPVLLDYDEQSDLTREQRSHFRAKEGDPAAIERITSESTPPAHQISPTQMNAEIPAHPQAVDELLSELDVMLEEIDEEMK